MKNESELDKNLRFVAKSSVIIFIGIILSKILTYAYRAIIARNFGPEIYGVFSLAIMIIGFFTIFSYIGLNDGIIRFISFYRGKNEHSKINFTFKKINKFVLGSSIFFAIILFFTSELISLKMFNSPELVKYLKVLSLFFPFSVLTGIYLSTLLAFEKAGWNSILSNITQNLIRLILLLVGIWVGIGKDSILISYSLSIILLFIISHLVLKKVLPQLFKTFNLDKKQEASITLKIFSYSWPIMFSGTIYGLFNWTDSFMIGYLNDVTQVGLYNAAFTLVTLLGVVPSLFNQIFLPIIVKEYAKNKKVIVKELSQQIGKWIMIINLPLFLILIIFPEAAINIFFGSNFLSAANSLRILSFGGLISSLTPILFSLFSMIGKSRLLLINILSATLLNFILNLIMIAKWGINGAALATTISLIVLSLSLMIQIKYLLSIIPLRRKIIKVILVSIFPTFLLVYLRNFFDMNFITITLITSFYLLVYILLIFLTGCLDKNDFKIIEIIKRRFLIFKTNSST